jgi:hypothetical protein
MKTIYIPAKRPEEWAQFLAEPIKHWRTGYSARTLAYAWQEQRGFPEEVSKVLQASSCFPDIEMLLGLPEHQVDLPGGRRPSQNDIWVLARANRQLISIAVEGKVSEPFDMPLEEWLAGASRGKLERLNYLCEVLGMTTPVPGHVRYQLLHRTASAIIEARRFCATHAVLLIHSFSQTNEWFDDYREFAKLFGVDAKVDELLTIGTRKEITVHLCWVRGNKDCLTR